MSKVVKTPRRLAVGTSAVTAAFALGGSLLVAAPAQASPDPSPAAEKPYGTVTAPSGLNERQHLSTDSLVRGHLPFRAQVGLKCKVKAQSVEGNPVWYLLRDRPHWVSAKYVDNTGSVEFCKDVQRDHLPDSPQTKTPKG
jgi:hypothetical protein